MKILKEWIVLSLTLFIFTMSTMSQDIHVAAKQGNLENVQMLLKKDPELIDIKDENGKTPLHWACQGVHIKVVKYLIENGADVNVRDNNQIAPLHNIAARNHIKAAELLINNGTQVDIIDGDDSTPLHIAAYYGHYDMAKFLLQKGADVNAKKHGKFTPLHYTCFNGFDNVARLLIDNGAEIEALNVRNRTPLILAARESGDIEILSYLLKKGSNINAVDKYGDNALSLAAWRGFSDAANLLIKNGAELPQNQAKIQSLLVNAVDKKLDRLFYYLVDKGVNINIKNNHKGTLLHSAAIGGSPNIIQYFLDHNFDVNAIDRNGWTPLHYAAEKGRIEAIELLVRSGTNINTRTMMGQTALNIAEEHNYTESVEILIDNGADLSPTHFPALVGEYFGQKVPGLDPELFAPGIVSAHYRFHSSIIFSPDGKEAFWTVLFPPRDSGYGTGKLMTSIIMNNNWTYPKLAPFNEQYRGDVPFFHPDGNKLFFISRRPFKQGAQGGKENIWYIEKKDGKWSAPKPIGLAVNSKQMHWQFSIDKYGNLLYSSDKGIYYSKFRNEEFQRPESIIDVFKNETLNGSSPYISPNGDYLIFAAESESNSGGDNDLYISFRKKDEKWSDAISFGKTINTKDHELCPIVTPDGKFLFFLRSGENYWVDAKIIEELRPKE